MTQANTQRKIEAYRNIIRYHGILRGFRRVFDQFTQNDWYDFVHGTNFSQILSGDSFYQRVEGSKTAVMHYQPVYTSAVKRPVLDLIRHYPVVGASSTCFMDLGCGRGKALHVAKSALQHVTPIGVELNHELLVDAKKNLTQITHGPLDSKGIYINENVNNVDYAELLSPFDVVIVFNKNSFDKATTEDTLQNIMKACVNKSLFYIYSNPVFEDSFREHECVFSMQGWHKNWNTKTFKVNTDLQ